MMVRRIAVAAVVCALGFGANRGMGQMPLTPVGSAVPAATGGDALMQGFENPPNGARPRVWWHWMNGNISEDGIRLDLNWMKRVGVGGVTIFEGSNGTPQVVPERLIYMTPAWKKAFSYAVTTAKGLGMEVAIASSPGWSETGGPWVPPAEAMKKMVWSTLRVEGGKPFTGVLPHPPEVSGAFQDFRVPGRQSAAEKAGGPPPVVYRDVAVLAYRVPEGDKTQAELNPTITASGGTANVAGLSDGDVATVALEVPAEAPGGQAWVEYDYGHPQLIQAVTLATLGDQISVFDHESNALWPWIEASNDGVTFKKVAEIPGSSVPERTVAFDAVTARYFRVVFATPAGEKQGKNHEITELVLASGARVNAFEKRAGFANSRNYFAIGDPKVDAKFVVPEGGVVDLTDKMKADGTLEWTPGPGEWNVVRIGSSLTGHENGPAPAEATGLEVDKFNKGYVKNYIDGYLKMYADTVGAGRMGPVGISHLLTDSIEVGPQNWTDNMLAEFKERRGYDARPWLPAMTGVVIKSPEATERFLWDVRRTIGELIAQNHYGEIADELHAHGMGYYAEALEFHRPSLGDDMEMRSKADIPMGAMWTWAGQPDADPDYMSDLRGAASVGHIYGQNLVGAESMTSRGPGWSFSPNSLKKVVDLEFALGVNRFEIHESSHQPVVDMAPGMTLGPYGVWFNRNETWAEAAGPWVNYLARCSYMLQQGHYYGDVAYFYGEEGPLTAVFGWKAAEDLPEGYGFDFVNSDVLLHHVTLKDGRLTTTGGTSYRVLYLGGRSQRMTLGVLKQIRDLVMQGAVVVGNRPADSPSLADDEKAFQTVADELWGKASGKPSPMRKMGKGRVYTGKTANEVLADLAVAPDWEYTKPEADTKLLFLHRKLADGDAYFVDNRRERAETLEATFRVEGKTAELWDAATGKAEPVSYKTAGGRTTVPLHLDPWGSVFVVFRKAAAQPELKLAEKTETVLSAADNSLDKDWIVRFQPGRGAPAGLKMDELASWSASADAGVKYFSGTAAYQKTIDAPAAWFAPGARLWLDLGDVKDVADVTVNGKQLGVLWKTPYKVDVTGVLVPGRNLVVVKVTNLWVNRLIGDMQPWALRKYTFTDVQLYNADSPLVASGLLGPVRVVEEK